MYQKILVPVDGSSQSLAALQHSIKLAKVSGSTVTLFYVLQDSNSFANGKADDRSADESDTPSGEKVKAQEMLKKLKESFSDHEVRINTAITAGKITKEICKKAEIEGYDVIVMGSRGLGKIDGILKGSVSKKVSRDACCPVIVIQAH